MTVYWPNGSLTRPHVTSDYDPARKNPVTGIVQAHNGIDLIGWTDNCSPVDGTVVFAGYNGGAGNEVRIRADGLTAFHVGDYYRILHHASLYVRTGDRVKARQPVGRMGTTGQSTGVHCHFETHEWRLWNPVNPTDYMSRANAGGSAAGGGASPFDPSPEDDMYSDDDRARDVRIEQKIDRLATVIGGSADGPSIIELVRNGRDLAKLAKEAAEWSKARQGGTAARGSQSITDQLRQIRDVVLGIAKSINPDVTASDVDTLLGAERPE